MMSFVEIVLIACGVFAGVILAMAVGVIFGNRQIKGSCGGLNGLKDQDGNPLCDSCSTPSDECQEMMNELPEEKSSK